MKKVKLEMSQCDKDVPALGHYMGKEKIHANFISINEYQRKSYPYCSGFHGNSAILNHMILRRGGTQYGRCQQKSGLTPTCSLHS